MDGPAGALPGCAYEEPTVTEREGGSERGRVSPGVGTQGGLERPCAIDAYQHVNGARFECAAGYGEARPVG